MKSKPVIWGAYLVSALLGNLLSLYFLNQLMLPGAVIMYAVIIIVPILFFILLYKAGQPGTQPNLLLISVLMAASNMVFYYIFSSLIIEPAQMDELTRTLSKYNSQEMKLSLSVTGLKPVITIGIINFLTVMITGYGLYKRKEVR